MGSVVSNDELSDHPELSVSVYNVTDGSCPIRFVIPILETTKGQPFIVLAELVQTTNTSNSINALTVDFPNAQSCVTSEETHLFVDVVPKKMYLVPARVLSNNGITSVNEVIESLLAKQESTQCLDKLLMTECPELEVYDRLCYHLITDPYQMVMYTYGLASPMTFSWNVFYTNSSNEKDYQSACIRSTSDNGYNWSTITVLGNTYCIPRILGAIYISVTCNIPFSIHLFHYSHEIQVGSVRIHDKKLLEEVLGDDFAHIFMFALVVSHCKHNDDALPPLTGKDKTVLSNKFNGPKLDYSVQRCDMSTDGFQCATLC